MGRFPDADLSRYLQSRMASSIQFFGQSVTYKKYISASGSYPEFGMGDTGMYQLRPATFQIRPLTVDETQAMGGQIVGGSLAVWSTEPVGQRDEMVYQGTAYRCTNVPTMEQIGNTLYYRSIFTVSQVTGAY